MYRKALHGILALVSIRAAPRKRALFAANYRFLPFALFESSRSHSFTGHYAGLVCCKAGGGAGCFRLVVELGL